MNRIELLIEDMLNELGDLPAPVIAGKVRAKLEEEDPNSLTLWLEENLEALLAQVVGRMKRERHARNKRRASRESKFANAAQIMDTTGDRELLAEFLHYDDTTVVADGTTREVSQFTANDHNFVAAQYQSRGRTALMLAAFHRQVGRMLGRRRTSEVLSAEDYEKLHDSIRHRMT